MAAKLFHSFMRMPQMTILITSSVSKKLHISWSTENKIQSKMVWIIISCNSLKSLKFFAYTQQKRHCCIERVYMFKYNLLTWTDLCSLRVRTSLGPTGMEKSCHGCSGWADCLVCVVFTVACYVFAVENVKWVRWSLSCLLISPFSLSVVAPIEPCRWSGAWAQCLTELLCNAVPSWSDQRSVDDRNPPAYWSLCVKDYRARVHGPVSPALGQQCSSH